MITNNPGSTLLEAQNSYATCLICGGAHDHPTAQAGEKEMNMWEKLFGKLYRAIFDKKLKAAIPAEQYLKKATILNKAFTEGFKERLNGLDYDSPDHLRIAMYQANIHRFAAASTWQEVVELNKFARESKDFSEFKLLADGYKGIKAKYLRTEYNHSQAASQSAADWLRYSDPEQAEQFDLEYETAGDDRVRPEHADLDGVVAALNDPIWNVIYPPNGFGCRCVVNQVLKGSKARTDTSTLSLASVPKNFRINYGKTDHLFEAAHSYFDSFPDAGKLDWENFGLPKWEDLDRAELAPAISTITNQRDYEKWWDKELARLDRDKESLYYKDFLGRNIRIDSSRRSQFKPDAENLEDILQNADEVWLNNDDQAQYKTTYLKKYQDKQMGLVVSTEDGQALEVITWQEITPEKIEEQRKGIIIKSN